MDVAPNWMVAGEPVVIFGRLRCADQRRAAGRQVRLFHHLIGQGGGFTYVQSVTTDAHGFYVIDRADGVVESNRLWYVRSLDARSSIRGVHVAATVTLNGPTEGQLLTGHASEVTFTGTVSPADIGARVILQRQNGASGREWHPIGRGVVVAGATPGTGSFTIPHTFRVPGDANIRVLVHSQGRNVPSASNVRVYEITQAQNPKLTILASADPIAFGESVTISGKLEGGAGVPVTLLARTAFQRGFAPVAQVSANPNGEYTFPAQAPVNSTFYRTESVAGACRLAPHGVRRHCPGAVRSAVLYEGVKDVLTAQVSATTVQAGQPLTFSGTVAPDHTGHTIYLEAQNSNPHVPGYHVIEVGTIGTGSTYSIVRRFYAPGTRVVRVFVPGGPDNGGAASQPFTIDVLPISPAALSGEPSQNSSLPPEGQS